MIQYSITSIYDTSFSQVWDNSSKFPTKNNINKLNIRQLCNMFLLYYVIYYVFCHVSVTPVVCNSKRNYDLYL